MRSCLFLIFRGWFEIGLDGIQVWTEARIVDGGWERTLHYACMESCVFLGTVRSGTETAASDSKKIMGI